MLREIKRGAFVAALLAATIPSRASSATFDLHLRPYCATADCGHASRQAYEDFLCASVEELNLEYEKAGVSFRPTIAPNEASAPAGGLSGFPADKNQYSELDVGAACTDDDGIDAQLAAAWRMDVAAANPAEITYLLQQNRDWNCSQFPWKATPYGIIGDAAMSRGTLGSGALLAHEIGHYFGLLHTFTDQDPATQSSPVWDGDVGTAGQGLVYVTDTPDDPQSRENCPRYCGGDPGNDRCNDDSDCVGSYLRVCNPNHDEDMNGNPVDGHVWNAVNQITNGADPGSPRPDTCTLTWIERANGQSIATFPSVTQAFNAMSYYPAACTGPIVVSGDTLEPFSDEQIDRMQDSRVVYAVRDATNLPDVCSGHGGDTDHDGICDDVDTCRFVSNLCDQNTDGDGDGRPDGCDNCPGAWNPAQEDLDGDGDGDACDLDDDGDGCFDQRGLSPQDQHPDSATARTGTLLYSPYCTGEGDKTRYDFEGGGIDTDGDGVPDCADYDDDDDGQCDDDETLSGSAPGVPPNGCVGPDPCPLLPEPTRSCASSSSTARRPPGGRLWLRVELHRAAPEDRERDQPRSTTELVFDRIEIVNQTLYALPPAGSTASQSVKKIGALGASRSSRPPPGRPPASRAPPPPPPRDASRSRSGGGRRGAGSASSIGEFDAATLALGERRAVRSSASRPSSTHAGPRPSRRHYLRDRRRTMGAPDRDRDGAPTSSTTVRSRECRPARRRRRRHRQSLRPRPRQRPRRDRRGREAGEELRRRRLPRFRRLCATDEERGAALRARRAGSVAVPSRALRGADLNGDGRVDRADTASSRRPGLALHAVAVDPCPGRRRHLAAAGSPREREGRPRGRGGAAGAGPTSRATPCWRIRSIRA